MCVSKAIRNVQGDSALTRRLSGVQLMGPAHLEDQAGGGRRQLRREGSGDKRTSESQDWEPGPGRVS